MFHFFLLHFFQEVIFCQFLFPLLYFIFDDAIFTGRVDIGFLILFLDIFVSIVDISCQVLGTELTHESAVQLMLYLIVKQLLPFSDFSINHGNHVLDILIQQVLSSLMF